MSAGAPLVHRSVLLREAVEALAIKPDGVYVDATFGRGGHSREILAQLGPQGRLIALDHDLAAIAAGQSLGNSDARFVLRHARFSEIGERLDELAVGPVDGVLLDIGVSSPQIDDSQRGFSLRSNGPLDMRMDPSRGETAAEWLARATTEELTRVIRDYGEERFAASIAKAIVACRAHGRPPSTTAELAAVVADAIPVKSRKDALQHPATRTFQAVRIHVNQELEELALALEQAASMLTPGGRLVVISFHSLEDRVVKRFIERRAHPDRPAAAARHLPLRAADLPRPTLHHPVRPQEHQHQR